MFFGDVDENEAWLSPVGEIARQHWADIPTHFGHARLDEFVVMPNHVHGIVIIEDPGVEASDVRPGVETRHVASLQQLQQNRFGPLKPGSLQAIMHAYKAAVTRWCRQNGHDAFAWQPRYYEHIIRNDQDLARIRQYIRDNPAQWANDRNSVGNLWM
jgi:REP element-mobilizing transposase RayT